MCATCGCATTVHDHSHDHPHDHAHDHAAHDHDQRLRFKLPSTVKLEARVLDKNQRRADENRAWLAAREILALNLVSSPGSGKTTLLERTIRDVGAELLLTVIEGDQATDHDAARIRAAGARAVQINTGSGCHLDAAMVAGALAELGPSPRSTCLIENVGNLVCPALFDLGEHKKVVVMSVTEGEDKPLKYPHMFRAGNILVLNKIDLLPHVSFDVERCLAFARQVNPSLEILRLSATRGDGLDGWYDLLRRESRARASA